MQAAFCRLFFNHILYTEMKFLRALLVAGFASLTGHAQIVALSPTGDGGFESGTTFAANNWTVINPATTVHQWVLNNTAPAATGSRGAHVSNDGTSYAYTPAGGQRTCHLYHDVTIPSGSVSITLTFNWKGQGQAGLDQLLVYTAPSTFVPVVNAPVSPSTTMSGATLVWTQPSLTSTYTAATVSLPSTLAGTTFRLVFTWMNDATGGTTPPAAIDDISVTYNCAAPAPITGTPTLCVGGSSTLTDLSAGGTWSSSNTSVATVTSGIVVGMSAGTATISYTTTCASPATTVVTVYAAPSAIAGPSTVCQGQTITLTNTSGGGSWSSSSPSYATVGASTGVVTGIFPGAVNISYSNSCGTPATKSVTVLPAPSGITGQDSVCEGGGVLSLTNATHGGTWSISPVAYASIAGDTSGHATVTGIATGTALVTYTTTTGCSAYKTVTVAPLPPAIVGTGALCPGAVVTLSDPLPGGTWVSSAPGIATISSSGTVIGVAAGTTVISYRQGCGAATTVVTVYPVPSTIIGDSVVCVGGTTTYANAVLGGTWSSSIPSRASVMPTSGVITGISAGISNITYTVPGGCYKVRQVKVVNYPSGSITGTMEVCPGTSTLLTAPVAGGTWMSYGPASATVGTSGTVTGVAADTVTIRYTTTGGCHLYAQVTVHPLPAAILSNSHYCSNSVDTLFDPTPGGSWSSITPSNASIAAATGIMTAGARGTAVIKYTLPTGCAVTKSITIDSLPTPSLSFLWCCNTIQTNEGFSSYQWYHSIHGMIVGATGPSVAGMYNGTYYVVVTDDNGCVGTSSGFSYSTSMGVDDYGVQQGERLYPNPANSTVHLSGEAGSYAEVYSMDGRKVLRLKGNSDNDINVLPAAMYTVRIYNYDGVLSAVEKLVKQ